MVPDSGRVLMHDAARLENVTESAPAGRVRLSPADLPLVGVTRRTLLAYRLCPDVDRLEAWLRQLCSEIPDVAGKVVQGEDGELYLLRNAAPVEFEVTRASQGIPESDARRPFDDQGINADVRSMKSRSFAPLRDPLLRVGVRRYSCGGAVIALDFAHALTDGSGRGWLLAHWARLCRGDAPLPPFDLHREALIDIAERNQHLAEESDHMPVRIADLVGRMARYRSEQGAYRVLTVPARAVVGLKVECLRRLGGSHVSTQDVLTAKIWQIFSLVQPGRQGGSLSMIRDFRRVPGIGLSPRYFGNALTNAHVFYDVDEARRESVAALALRIRESSRAALAFRKVATELALLWRNRHLRRQGVMIMGKDDFNAFGDDNLMINNLSRFPLRDLDFGTGPPLWVGGVRQPTSPSVGIMPLSAAEDAGYALHFNLEARQMERLLDVTAYDPFFGPNEA